MRTQQGVSGWRCREWGSDQCYRSLDRNEALSVVKKYGSQSSAHFLFQEDINYFGQTSEAVIGFACYKGLFGHINIVFANPVCAPGQLDTLLTRYLEKQQVPTLFLGVDKVVSERLIQHGYSANQIGIESYIDLKKFDTVGKHKKQLRHAANFGVRHLSRVVELPWSNVDAEQVMRLSREWRARKGVSQRELKLLTRPPVFDDEPLVRKFYCFQGEKLLGFVFFEPYFNNGKVAGYCANIIRSLSDSEYSGISDYIILEAVKRFRTEGVERLSLGLSPLYKIQATPHDRASIRVLLNLMYRHANSLYAFKGLAYHKTRYRPIQEPWYLCSKGLNMPKLFGALFFGLGVF